MEAVQKAKELQPDLILLDIGLPNLNGLEVANRIRQVASSAKILFLTNTTDKDIVRAALGTGGQGYILKIDAGRELLAAVAVVLGGDDFVSSGIEGSDSGKPRIHRVNGTKDPADQHQLLMGDGYGH